MSKIQFNELNNSELEVLNTEATAEVVGGYYYGGYSSYYSSYSYSDKVAAVSQFNGNDNAQAAFGGGYFSNTSNRNGTSQNNSAHVSQ